MITGTTAETPEAPAAIPLTLTLQQSTIRVALPLPHSTEDDQIRTLIFVVGTSEAPPSFTRIVSWTLQPVGQLSKEEEEQLRVALEAGGAGGRDLVEMIRRLEQALRT